MYLAWLSSPEWALPITGKWLREPPGVPSVPDVFSTGPARGRLSSSTEAGRRAGGGEGIIAQEVRGVEIVRGAGPGE